MDKYVLVIKEDVCSINEKYDSDIIKLLEVAHKYGDVLKYEDCVAADKAEMQAVIDNLKSRIDALVSVELTEPEKGMVNAFRDCKAASDRAYIAEIEKKDKMINKISGEMTLFVKQVKDICVANEVNKTTEEK